MTPMMVNFVSQLGWIADTTKRTEGKPISSGDLQMVIRELYRKKATAEYNIKKHEDGAIVGDIITSVAYKVRIETLDEVCTMLCKLWQHQTITCEKKDSLIDFLEGLYGDDEYFMT